MKERPQPILHRISKNVLLISLFTAALLSVGGRVLLSQVEYFKTEIEQELADYGITGVRFDAIAGSWRGLHPLLKVDGASLSIPGRSHALSINQLELSVKLFSSLLHSDLELLSLHSNIEKLILVRDEEGRWWLNDIALGAQDDSSRIDIHEFFARLPDYTEIDVRLLQIRDLRQDKEYLIQRARLHALRDEGELNLKLDGHLPRSLGGEFVVVLRGNARQQQMYIEAEHLNLANLGGLAGSKLPGIDQAEVSVQGWIDLNGYRAQRIVTDLEFSQVVLTSARNDRDTQSKATAEQQAGPIRFRSRVLAERDASAWQMDVALGQVFRGEQQQPPMRGQLVLFHDARPLQFWIERIDVQALRELLADLSLVEEYSELLDQLELRAMINELVVELDLDDPAESSLSFDFSRLRAKRLGKVPGVTGLAGRMLASQRRGQIELGAERVAVDFGDFFRLPIKLERVQLAADFEWTPQQLLLQANDFSLVNPDLVLEGRGFIEIPRSGRPFLGLRAAYRDGDVSATSRYLPVAVMPQDTVAWLDTSLKNGRISRGDLLFHGRLKSLKHFAQDYSGEFHALFDARDPVVEPYGGWPRISQGSGSASFHNTSMDLRFGQVKFAQSNADQVRVQIPDMFHSELLIDVQTATEAGSLLETLSAMPVLDTFDLVRDKTDAIGGRVRADVHVFVPLHSDPETELAVTAKGQLERVSLRIPEWMVDFDQVSGAIDIENQWVSGQQLTGLYAGDPVTLNIVPDRKLKLAGLTMSGVIDAQALTLKLPVALAEPVSGRGNWQVDVAIPVDDSFDQRGVDVLARSDLAGIELAFPEPLRVAQDASTEFQVKLNLREREIDFSSRLLDRVVASGRLEVDHDDEFSLQSLNLDFDADKITTVKDDDIWLSGHIAQLDLNGWLEYKSAYFPDSGNGSDSVLSKVAGVYLQIEQAEVASQQVEGAQVSLEREDDRLQGRILSPLVKGEVTIPHQMSGDHPIMAELEYIRWRKSDGATEFDPEIDDIPDLSIRSKVLAYDDMEFHDLVLRSRHQDDRYIVEQLDFWRDSVRLRSSGHWQVSESSGEQVSVFNIDIRGSNFGETVKNLGLGDGFRDGEVAFNGQLGWGGHLFGINWPTLIGEVQLSLKDGYLNNVEPGAGRFVGLLSLNALPRRLFLDFSDVLADGMQFDEIKGHFSIAGEIMNTDDAVMESDAAEVRLEGITNLREMTYDQRMYIVPQIGNTLPVIGGLTAGNAVGWGLLLLQKIFEKPIDKSVEIEYKVSGSWDDPNIELVEAPPPDTDDDPVYPLESND